MKEKKFKKFTVNKTPIEDKSTISGEGTRQGNKFADFDVEELFKYDFKEDERVRNRLFILYHFLQFC